MSMPRRVHESKTSKNLWSSFNSLDEFNLWSLSLSSKKPNKKKIDGDRMDEYGGWGVLFNPCSSYVALHLTEMWTLRLSKCNHKFLFDVSDHICPLIEFQRHNILSIK